MTRPHEKYVCRIIRKLTISKDYHPKKSRIKVKLFAERRRIRSGEESGGLFVNFGSDEDNNDLSIQGNSHDTSTSNRKKSDGKLFSLSTPSNVDHNGPASLVLGTGNRINNNSSNNNNFYSLVNSNNSSEDTSSQSNASASQSVNSSSYLSLRTKLKAVQEKYRKSSMSDKIKSKFTKPGRTTSGKISGNDSPGNLEGMSKFLSYSHGALADLEDYPHRQQQQQQLQQQSMSQQTKRRNDPTKEQQQQQPSDVTTVVALIEPPPHSVSSQSSKSSNFSQPSTPRTRPDFDEIDSGILNEIEEVGSAESLSSGSDSGFYPTGNEERRNTVRRNKKLTSQAPEVSPRCSRCSIHSDGSSYDDSKECDAHQNLEGDLKERGRASRGVTRRHSRASSVDRREIFTKYVARGSEHSVAIHPFASHDPGKLDRFANYEM